MPGLDPGIHGFAARINEKWMAGTSSAKTSFALQPGHNAARRFIQDIK
jgi:hypothetical protein